MENGAADGVMTVYRYYGMTKDAADGEEFRVYSLRREKYGN